MTTYRPSAVVRLTIRVEEFEDTSALDALLPEPDFETAIPDPFFELPPAAPTASESDSSSERLAQNQERRRALQTRRDSLAPEQYQSQLTDLIYEEQDILEEARQVEEAEQGNAPESVAGSPPDDLTVIGNIYPRSATIERNGLAQADTSTIEISWVDAPLDPRIIRAAHVQLVIGSREARDYESGVSENATRPDGSLTSVIQADDAGATEFLGFVDSWAVDYSDKGDILVFECRDMSAPIRDRDLGRGETIDLTLPIDQGIQEFLRRLGPTTDGIEVAFFGEGEVPTPGVAFPQRRRTRRGGGTTRGRTSGDKMTAWDHITDVVRATGFLPVMRGFRLMIIEPRTLYETIGITRMVYGRNIEQLRFERSLLGITVPTIEVRCYDSERGRAIWGRYPVAAGQRSSGVLGLDATPRPSRANRVPPSGSTPDESIRHMSVSGVTDPGVLERIARNAFEQLGRQEITGSFTTKDIWSYDSPPEDADLLDLDAGDAIELLMVQADERDEQSENSGEAVTNARIQAMSRSRRRDYLMSLGWDRRVADRFASLQDATGFQTAFRVSKTMIRYSANNGINLGIDFMNFITVREES